MRAPAAGWLLEFDAGLVDYIEAWALQRALVAARQEARVPDVLLLLEHAPVITIGRRGRREHVLLSPDELRRRGISVYEVERGGDVTYHGPGQLVGYPIVHLRALGEDVVRYVRLLEETVIVALAAFGIAAGRERGYPGVWVDGAKICAVGVAVKRAVTMHGLALNVATPPEAFAAINPCGLGRPVTSMAAVLGRPVALADVRRAYAAAFTQVLGRPLRATSLQALPDDVRRRAAAERVALAAAPAVAGYPAGRAPAPA
ncbi:MAG: lipoyl(octanoyl) transferase LipB [Firmicutes bacterium]|nr:lipoyl(octanoyl) transferase LipB [Bacillota bacterium]